MLCQFTSTQTVKLSCSDGKPTVTGYGTGLSFIDQCQADELAYNLAYQNAFNLRNLNPCGKITGSASGALSSINSFSLINNVNDYVGDALFMGDGLIDDQWNVNITFPSGNGAILQKIRISRDSDDGSNPYMWATTTPQFAPLENFGSFYPLMVFNGNLQLNNNFTDILGNFYGTNSFSLYGSHKIIATIDKPFKLEVVIDNQTYHAVWPVTPSNNTVGNIQNLLNIDYQAIGSGVVSLKAGLAAIGISNVDFWNLRSSGTLGKSGYLSNPIPLNWMDNTLSPITNGCLPILTPFITITGTTNTTNDPMFSGAGQLPNGMVTLNNVPKGIYDLYVYAYTNFPFNTSTIQIKVPENNTTLNKSCRSDLITLYSGIWKENIEYVKFNLSLMQNFDTYTINISANNQFNNISYINGLQLVQYGTGYVLSSPAPLTNCPSIYVDHAISSLINVNFGPNSGNSKIGLAYTGFSCGDIWNDKNIDLSQPLLFADGTSSNVNGYNKNINSSVLQSGFISTFDEMLSSFMINPNGLTLMDTFFSGFQNGYYDIYLYGLAPGNTIESFFQLSINPWTNPQIIGSYPFSISEKSSTKFIQNSNFCRFQNVLLYNTDILDISWVHYFNGAQFLMTSGLGTIATPTFTGIVTDNTLGLNIDTITQSSAALHWTNIYNYDINGFRIERKTVNVAYSEVTSIGILSDFIDTYLNSSTDYCYRIRGFNNTGFYPYSNEVCIQTLPSCGSPNLFCSDGIFPKGTIQYAGVGNITIYSSNYCNWTAYSDSPDWITFGNEFEHGPRWQIPLTIDGQGNNVIGYFVRANNTNSVRQGRVYVGNNYITVTQNNI